MTYLRSGGKEGDKICAVSTQQLHFVSDVWHTYPEAHLCHSPCKESVCQKCGYFLSLKYTSSISFPNISTAGGTRYTGQLGRHWPSPPLLSTTRLTSWSPEEATQSTCPSRPSLSRDSGDECNKAACSWRDIPYGAS